MTLISELSIQINTIVNTISKLLYRISHAYPN